MEACVAPPYAASTSAARTAALPLAGTELRISEISTRSDASAAEASAALSVHVLAMLGPWMERRCVGVSSPRHGGGRTGTLRSVRGTRVERRAGARSSDPEPLLPSCPMAVLLSSPLHSRHSYPSPTEGRPTTASADGGVGSCSADAGDT